MSQVFSFWEFALTDKLRFSFFCVNKLTQQYMYSVQFKEVEEIAKFQEY